MEIATTIITNLVTSVVFIMYISTIVKRVEIVEKEIKEIKYNYTDRFQDIKDDIHKVDTKVEIVISKVCKDV